jgi:hypothetical protein
LQSGAAAFGQTRAATQNLINAASHQNAPKAFIQSFLPKSRINALRYYNAIIYANFYFNFRKIWSGINSFENKTFAKIH